MPIKPGFADTDDRRNIVQSRIYSVYKKQGVSREDDSYENRV